MSSYKPNREELAWSAGFFDGEGNVRCRLYSTPRGTGYRGVDLQVTQLAQQPLIRLRDALQVGKVLGPYTQKNPKGMPYFSYRVTTFIGVQHAAACLWPWLCEVKRDQFTTTLRQFHDFVPTVAPCDHGNLRQKCHTCRSEWTSRAWATRKASA